MKLSNRSVWGCAWSLALWVSAATVSVAAPDFVTASHLAEFRRLGQEIADFRPDGVDRVRVAQETLRPDALIQAADRTPVDVILRRTRALTKALAALPQAPDLGGVRAELARLGAANRDGLTLEQQQALFLEVCALRRQIALRNPLLTFKDIVFLKHARQASGESHMVDQYFGFNASPGGGLFVLRDAFGPAPRAENLLAQATVANGRLKGRRLDSGSFISLDLDYDAQTLAFAWTEGQSEEPGPEADWTDQPWNREEMKLRGGTFLRYYWSPQRTYHVFKVRADGTRLTQLTDGAWNEYDPCFLPNDRLVFISERPNCNARCGARWCATAVLHGMMADGSDIIPLSFHETNEWQPSVDNNGMLVYTRWDYIDREANEAHHLWSCYPDGRDPRSSHGNYPRDRPQSRQRPNMEVSIRAIPGSRKYLAVAAPHHGFNYGSVVQIDPASSADDGAMAQVRRVTPEVFFPEVEKQPGLAVDVTQQVAQVRSCGNAFGQPWPLNEDFFLCIYDFGGDWRHALTLADSFGNRIVLYQSPDVPCLDPIPFAPRPTPPVIPTLTHQAKADGAGPATSTVAIMNVYEGERPLPAGVKISAIRVVNIFPKDNAWGNQPNIGGLDQALARGVLGTAPVEADGSAFFEMPAGVEVYFQALDERGCAVMSMRSGTYTHPGERLSCVGCHESKCMSAAIGGGERRVLALQRPPSQLKAEPAGSWPLTFPRLVQPVLDAKCVACHRQKGGRAPDLSGELFPPLDAQPAKNANEENCRRLQALNGVTTGQNGWSRAYASLGHYAWRPDLAVNYSTPGAVGARASRLWAMLQKGHHDVRLTDEEWRRLIVWLDCASLFYGSYKEPLRQARGELILPGGGYPSDWQRYAR